MPKLQTRGFSTFYQQSGTGPDVVLLHAFTGNLAMWVLTGIQAALAEENRVTSYDLRGHGASEVVPSGYDSANLAADFLDLRQSLDLKPAILIGHSYGGVVALHAALLAPEQVRGVILADSYFPGLRELEPAMGQAAPWQDLRSTLSDAGLEIGQQVDFQRLFASIRDLPAERMKSLQKALDPANARWLGQVDKLSRTRAAIEAFEIAGLTPEKICEVQQPIVALYDQHSPFNATCDYLSKNLKHCTVDVVPGAKHLAPVHQTEAFLGLVRKHLALMRSSTSEH